MAIKPLVVDTSPLILLAKIDAFPIIRELPYRFCIPGEVADEIDRGTTLGYPIVNIPWMDTRALANPISPIIRTALGLGEAAVIQLALENGIRHVCIDDLRGRRYARAAGLDVVGVLGLFARAKRDGIIEEFRPYADRLLAVGARYSHGIIEQIASDVGE